MKEILLPTVSTVATVATVTITMLEQVLTLGGKDYFY